MKLVSKSDEHSVFDHSSYLQALDADLADAEFSVLIQVPHITLEVVERWRARLQALIDRRVNVCLFLLKPEAWQKNHETDLIASARMQHAFMAIEALEAMKAHITLRDEMDGSLVVIDGYTRWQGAAVILDCNAEEQPRRYQSMISSLEIIREKRLDYCLVCRTERPDDPTPTWLDDVNTLGLVISERRKTLGLSQTQLASRASLPRSIIRDIETGKYSPSMGMLEEILACLGMGMKVMPAVLAPYTDEILRISNPNV